MRSRDKASLSGSSADKSLSDSDITIAESLNQSALASS